MKGFATNNERCLFLWLDDSAFLAVEARKRNIPVARVYRKTSKLILVMRGFHTRVKFPFQSIWYDSWKNNLERYDTVIIHASRITVDVVKYINYRDPTIRVIVWYWNPVDKCVGVEKYLRSSCEIWSFDENDCKKYGLKYNTQYYSIGLPIDNQEIEQDIFFVGSDKGRLKELLEFQSKVEQLGLHPYFHITKTGFSSTVKNYKYKKRISYTEILDSISKSRCIFDFVSENQRGLTLRPLEALFFSKKLITNDKNIVNRDFYHKDNIFVLGVDDLSKLPRFLDKSLYQIDRSIVLKYDIGSWLNRFFKTENVL